MAEISGQGTRGAAGRSLRAPDDYSGTSGDGAERAVPGCRRISRSSSLVTITEGDPWMTSQAPRAGACRARFC